MDFKGNIRRLIGGAVPALALREPEKSQKMLGSAKQRFKAAMIERR
jgi:hypothetical protein